MSTNNEHSLRRRMEKRLGKPVSDVAWDIAIEERYIEAALGAAHETGEDDLALFLSQLLRVEIGRHRPASSRVRRGVLHEPSPNFGPRIEAISRLAAEAAAGDPGVLRFRQHVLRR